MRYKILLPILLLLSLPALAKPLNFAGDHFSIEMPSGWSAIIPQPPQSLLAVQNAGKDEKFLVFAAKTSPKEHPDAAREARNGVRENMTKGGYKVGPEQPVTIGGVPFVTFTAHLPSGGTLTAYMAGVGDELYMLQAITQGQGDPNDSALQAAIQSFRLLPSTTTPADAPPAPSSAPRSGMSVSQLLWLSVLAIGIISVIRWLTSKRQKS